MAKNVTSLTLETLQTLDGTENVVMFDSAEGKRATLTTLSDYALKKHRSSGMDETIYDQGESLKQEITELKAAVGSPLVANTASEMIDQTKIYVYTGTETGYTAGHWYYYNDTEWEDGGVYNSSAVATDKTLTISDKAADAKTVGDALATKATPDQIDSKISANIDSTLSATGKAADAKATGDSLAEKASSSGMVDMAKSLVGGKYTSDKQPYHFRKSPSGGAKDEVIVGGSLAWNQLVQNGNFESASGWYAESTAPTVSDNTASYTGTSDGTMSLALRHSATVVADHKVLSIADVWCDSNNEYRIRYPFVSSTTSTTANTWTAIEKIGIVGSGETQLGVQSNSINGASYKCRKAMLIDLTVCFGTTIADYIYTLEQANAGAGVAWVKRYIDLDTYHEYDAGSIQSVEGLVSHDVVGFNQWDEEWELGGFAWATGEPITATDRIRSKNYRKCLPNTVYYGTKRVAFFFYDSNKSFISYAYNDNTTKLITTPANASYLKLLIENTTTYNHDICINISDPSRNGTYEAYEKHSYPLDPTVKLNGVFKLVSDHLEADGDRWYPDKGIERRYVKAVLNGSSSESWAYQGDYGSVSRFDITNLSPAPKMGTGANTNIISDKLQKGAIGTADVECINVHSSYTRIQIQITTSKLSSKDATGLKAYLASNPITVVHELATPTIETATPFQSPMLVGQTEEYVSDSVVPVGHDSRYYEDITGKVNNLPSDFSTLIAPVEVTFKATRNYTVGSYVIVNNQLYKVTSAISTGGTITPNSNVTATTIMAEIMALA